MVAGGTPLSVIPVRRCSPDGATQNPGRSTAFDYSTPTPDYGLRPSSGLRVLRLVPVGDAPKDFAAFMEGELKRFADKGTLAVKLAGYQTE